MSAQLPPPPPAPSAQRSSGHANGNRCGIGCVSNVCLSSTADRSVGAGPATHERQKKTRGSLCNAFLSPLPLASCTVQDCPTARQPTARPRHRRKPDAHMGSASRQRHLSMIWSLALCRTRSAKLQSGKLRLRGMQSSRPSRRRTTGSNGRHRSCATYASETICLRCLPHLVPSVCCVLQPAQILRKLACTKTCSRQQW